MGYIRFSSDFIPAENCPYEKLTALPVLPAEDSRKNEIEKALMDGSLEIKDVPQAWNSKYQEYLGITPPDDKSGVLQDVHWTFGFGYFPTYAIGNFYNSMYYKELEKAMDVDATVAAGDFKKLNGWMKEHVFARADLVEPKQWIREITGRDLTPDDFLDYLEEKYSKIYEL